ncbi:hypothetical protein F2Q70_00031742 [Brassica cretica]|uniref:Uncharacterized protein n=1 Tax=Brassica cretica TaxID=69181 RepID=A0A8S9FCJ0_BRACR|nr:hypothetical protein F2Q70_00031742 [Brassica cretica]
MNLNKQTSAVSEQQQAFKSASKMNEYAIVEIYRRASAGYFGRRRDRLTDREWDNDINA